MSYKIKFRWSLLASFLLAFLFVSEAYAFTLNNRIAKDIAEAYGYFLGQTYSLNAIGKKYPHLTRQAKMAEIEFNLVFLPSITNMDLLLKKYKEWQVIKNDLVNSLRKKINISQLTEQQAIDFIKLVKKRSKGKIKSPIIQTLLLYNPAYEKQPEKEFLDGFRQKYSDNGEGKAKGVSLLIELPRSWASMEADRPNIVRKFVSENGHGFETIMILIKKIPLPEGQKITAHDVQEMLNAKETELFLPPNGISIDSDSLTIEGLPGFWIRYNLEARRVRKKAKMEAISYTIFYGNKMIQIQCGVGKVLQKTNSKMNWKKFKTYEPLFDLVVNSLVIKDLYPSVGF